MDLTAKVYVAGHQGMVGSAVVRHLRTLGYHNIITRGRQELDLTQQEAVHAFMQAEKPDVAVIAAAKVGGIHANNTYPAEFIYQNLAIAQNTIHAAYRAGTARLLFLGSTCIYPKFAEQPMQESSLLSGELEATNEAYAIAKIAGLKLCQFYRKQYQLCYHSAMPTNLYGPGDNYHPENSHVLPALIRRMHAAKVAKDASVTIWGSGRPLREFLHADDAAAGIVHLLQIKNPPDWVNLGTGSEISIRELAELIQKCVGFEGQLNFDTRQPDGTPRKLTCNQLMASTGWQSKITLESGIEAAYTSYLQELEAGAVRE